MKDNGMFQGGDGRDDLETGVGRCKLTSAGPRVESCLCFNWFHMYFHISTSLLKGVGFSNVNLHPYTGAVLGGSAVLSDGSVKPPTVLSQGARDVMGRGANNTSRWR